MVVVCLPDNIHVHIIASIWSGILLSLLLTWFAAWLNFILRCYYYEDTYMWFNTDLEVL